MVDRFPTPRRNLRKVIQYNEKKVALKQATYLFAANFHKEITEMTAEEKIAFLANRNLLRPRCKANTPHITLSFHPSEKLSDETLTAIASAYMEGIGFGNQPYLVYKHLDTHHPHLHIVTTLIQADGSRIPTHKIGEKVCEPVRQRIEEQFGLVKAKGRRKKKKTTPGQARLRKLQYGQADTYRSIAEAVQAVLEQYIFTTVGEFNAILQQVNVLAETGRVGTKTAKRQGLYYRVLDETGKPKGVPIKASELPGKPTLKALQTLFIQNRPRQEEHLQSIRTRVEWALRQTPRNMPEFMELLGREQIKAVTWANEKGWIFGITFLDQKTKTAVNGRTLGREMSIATLQAQWARLAQSRGLPPQTTPYNAVEKTSGGTGHSSGYLPFYGKDDPFLAQLLQLFLQPVHQDDRIPFELSARKKKKKYNPPHT